jgi:hypothetical protein
LAPVAGGAEDDYVRPLDLTARPGRPARGLSARWVVERELTRLAGQHQPDGG